MNIKVKAIFTVPFVIGVVISSFGALSLLLVIALKLPQHFYMPREVHWAGIGVLALGFLLLIWVYRYRRPFDILVSTYISMGKFFRRKRPDDSCARTEPLVVAGPQRYVRNPLYFTVELLVLGWWMTLDWTFILLMAGFFFLWFNLVVIRFEEKELLALYGEQYQAYAKKVPKFFPSLWPRWP